ncbi:hypothetical protein [Amycolatopsis plumensis]|uniref:hypothetical protein n=1 Tax=Amycolatopsis plumensis TaxID=236508 RepID=UPI00361B250B
MPPSCSRNSPTSRLSFHATAAVSSGAWKKTWMCTQKPAPGSGIHRTCASPSSAVQRNSVCGTLTQYPRRMPSTNGGG